jgi:tetratricopeptide (TPR) repeat protein
MTHLEIESLYNKICKYLLSRNLKTTFDKLQQFIEWSQNGEWMDKKRELETTYQYMLQYAVNGINDPEQASIYNQLRISTLELADQVREQLLLRDSADFVSSLQRIQEKNSIPSNDEVVIELSSYKANASLAGLLEESFNASGKSIEFSKNHEKVLSSVFNHFWLTEKYKERETELLESIFKSKEIQFSDKCVIVSAITLSLIRTFDVVKFDMLLNMYSDYDEQIKQRAFIGFILGTYLFNDRIRLYEKLTTRIELLMQEKAVVKNLQTVILQFIQSKETEKISKKITEDFMPEMAKISPFIQEKMNLKDLMKEDNSLLDKNPEWQEILDKAGITDKIQQFAELQMEGADVFMSTFSSMKNFPFFRDINNWFMPFSNHSSVSEFFQKDNQIGILDTIVKSPFLCNSDKYSLVFSMLQMPKSYRDTMIQSLKLESEQMNEVKKDEELLAQSTKGDTISNQYIQDIYRFFKLYSRRKDFLDPFSKKLDLYNLFFIKNIENSTQLLRTVGETYFNKDFYDDAIEIFEKLLIDDNMNIELYQKTGYSYQRKEDYQKALSFYQKADMIKPDNLWNLRKMAFCYRNLKDSEKALKYYLLAEKQAPDNLNIQLSIGHCYFEQKMYNEALQVFFKIEYLAPQNTKVWRPIAWCSFITGKLDQAERYYEKIKDENRNHHDWLNMGHISLCMHDKKNALFLYKKSLELMDHNINSFLQIMDEDIPYLVNNGVDPNEIPIFMDKLRYDVKK